MTDALAYDLGVSGVVLRRIILHVWITMMNFSKQRVGGIVVSCTLLSSVALFGSKLFSDFCSFFAIIFYGS